MDASLVEGLDDDVVEDLDDEYAAPPGAHPDDAEAHCLLIDGIEEDDSCVGEGDGAGEGLPDANGAGGGPRALKVWPLPPSLTPKKRGRSGGLAEVTLDVDVRRSSADGAWHCAACDAAYETRTGLYAHARFCVGREQAWTCEWCACTEAETNNKASGPNGQRTLCSACGQRYRHGMNAMPTQNEKGEWVCAQCQRCFQTISAIGSHRRFCDGGAWRCSWCDCKYEDSNGKGPGPDGAMTLCSACAGRHRTGQTGPPPRNEEGKYICEKCERVFDSIPGLGSHRRRCDGGAWQCGWCSCSKQETSGKGPGPEGKGTLCSLCSQRWKSGHSGPPEKDAAGRYPCPRCERTFESYRALGVHSRDCDGGAWRCSWCSCRAEETQGKSPGPDGPRTLCGACASRYRAGHTGPPPRNEEGKYKCKTCGRAFENVSSLGGHVRFCDGGAWRCGWCQCKREETSGKGPGPAGGGTLCSLCSQRWRSGSASGPPEKDAAGRYPCPRCERTFESYRALGIHSRDCDGGSWRCSWCSCRAEETQGKSPGPDGPRTLCGACASRYRNGAVAPPQARIIAYAECRRPLSFLPMQGCGPRAPIRLRLPHSPARVP